MCSTLPRVVALDCVPTSGVDSPGESKLATRLRSLLRDARSFELSISVEPSEDGLRGGAAPPSSLDPLETSAQPRRLSPSPLPMPLPLPWFGRVVRSHGAEWENRVALAACLWRDVDARMAERVLSCCCTGAVYARRRAGTRGWRLSPLKPAEEPLELCAALRHCRCRVCPVCSDRYRNLLREGVARVARPYAWPAFITLTIQHDFISPLDELLDRLQHAWRKLQRAAVWRTVDAGVKIIEITHGENGWHPHVHVVADCRWIQQSDLAAAWRRATGGSSIVDVRRVKSRQELASYVSKYLSKPSAIRDPHLLAEYARATHGRRLVGCFGASYGQPLLEDHEVLDDPVPDPREGWVPVGSLEEWYRQALSGAAFARSLILRLCPSFSAALRAAPS